MFTTNKHQSKINTTRHENTTKNRQQWNTLNHVSHQSSVSLKVASLFLGKKHGWHHRGVTVSLKTQVVSHRSALCRRDGFWIGSINYIELVCCMAPTYCFVAGRYVNAEFVHGHFCFGIYLFIAVLEGRILHLLGVQASLRPRIWRHVVPRFLDEGRNQKTGKNLFTLPEANKSSWKYSFIHQDPLEGPQGDS